MQEAINAVVASTTETVEVTLVENLPAIFVIFGSLVALGLIIRQITKRIGRKA